MDGNIATNDWGSREEDRPADDDDWDIEGVAGLDEGGRIGVKRRF